jgi:polar amino acid transport system substrate-binding protein
MKMDRVEVLREMAPTGRLRVSINLGNSVLAQTDPATGAPVGVTVELAHFLGKELDVPVEIFTFKSAGAVFDAVKAGQLDIVFLAIDPIRAEHIAFTDPYALIEGNFVVATDSRFNSIQDIDQPGVRVAVARGSAYDLFLTRALKSATMVRMPTGDIALKTFIDEKLEASGGIRQPIVAFVAEHENLRLIESSFMEIRQAMGTPRGRDTSSAYLRTFVEKAKATGFVAAALQRSGQHDVVVAPASVK